MMTTEEWEYHESHRQLKQQKRKGRQARGDRPSCGERRKPHPPRVLLAGTKELPTTQAFLDSEHAHVKKDVKLGGHGQPNIQPDNALFGKAPPKQVNTAAVNVGVAASAAACPGQFHTPLIVIPDTVDIDDQFAAVSSALVAGRASERCLSTPTIWSQKRCNSDDSILVANRLDAQAGAGQAKQLCTDLGQPMGQVQAPQASHLAGQATVHPWDGETAVADLGDLASLPDTHNAMTIQMGLPKIWAVSMTPCRGPCRSMHRSHRFVDD